MDSLDPDDSNISDDEGPDSHVSDNAGVDTHAGDNARPDPAGETALGGEPHNSAGVEDPARSALGLVLALGLLVVVLALGLVALLVTSDDDSDNAASPAAGSNPEPAGSPRDLPSHDAATASAASADDPAPAKDAQRMISAIADRLGNDYEGIVTDTQAECMARAWVDVVGVERVPQLAQPGSATDSELQQINAAMRYCVGPETAAQLNLE